MPPPLPSVAVLPVMVPPSILPPTFSVPSMMCLSSASMSLPERFRFTFPPTFMKSAFLSGT